MVMVFVALPKQYLDAVAVMVYGSLDTGDLNTVFPTPLASSVTVDGSRYAAPSPVNVTEPDV
jgi:hypothetical protein